MILPEPIQKYIIVLSLFFTLKLAIAMPAKPIEFKLQALETIEEKILSDRTKSSAKQGEVIADAYKQIFHQNKPPSNFDNYNAEELEVFFLGASKAAFYSNSAQITAEMHRIFQKLNSISKPKKSHFITMYSAFLAARMLPDARRFLTQYPQSSTIPLPKFQIAKNITAAKASEWSVSNDGKTVFQQPLEIGRRPLVVIVSYPDCHFSQNAAKAILADTKLLRLLRNHMKWIGPQSRSFNVDTIRQWNLDYTEFPMTIIYKQNDMPMIDYWGTPSFYFFKDGTLKTKVIGWPKEGRINELIAGLKAIGIE